MLRMRLSLDCGCAAVATQGGSDNLFTVESLAANKGTDHAEAKASAGNRCVYRLNLAAQASEPGARFCLALFPFQSFNHLEGLNDTISNDVGQSEIHGYIDSPVPFAGRYPFRTASFSDMYSQLSGELGECSRQERLGRVSGKLRFTGDRQTGFPRCRESGFNAPRPRKPEPNHWRMEFGPLRFTPHGGAAPMSFLPVTGASRNGSASAGFESGQCALGRSNRLLHCVTNHIPRERFLEEIKYTNFLRSQRDGTCVMTRHKNDRSFTPFDRIRSATANPEPSGNLSSIT
jgi:hypothetical protein